MTVTSSEGLRGGGGAAADNERTIWASHAYCKQGGETRERLIRVRYISLKSPLSRQVNRCRYTNTSKTELVHPLTYRRDKDIKHNVEKRNFIEKLQHLCTIYVWLYSCLPSPKVAGNPWTRQNFNVGVLKQTYASLASEQAKKKSRRPLKCQKNHHVPVQKKSNSQKG